MTPPSDERKERVIHTRVPESLDDEIKRKARRLGVSVSNLVRNILEHTVELVEDVVIDSARIARAGRDEDFAEAAAPDDGPLVLGWQRAVLELNAVCDACNEILPRGTEASIALTQGASAPRFRCTRCLDGLAGTEGGADGTTTSA